MSNHIRLYNGPDTDDGGDIFPPLRLVGPFPEFVPEDGDYRGSIDIVDAIGRCTVTLLGGSLPPGYQLYVDNFTKKVMLSFPAVNTAETRSGIPNGDFELGEEGWETKSGWAVETVPYGSNSTNKAMVYRGPGSGTVRSARLPVKSGASGTFSGFWNQGPSNKDNVDLYTNLVVTREDGSEVTRFRGSKVGGLTNKSWHTSSGEFRIPTQQGDDLYGAVEHEVYRRNSRQREVMVDNTTWSIQFDVPAALDEYRLTISVRDSAGRVAVYSQVLSSSFDYITTQLYRVRIEDSMTSSVSDVGVSYVNDIQREANDQLSNGVGQFFFEFRTPLYDVSILPDALDNGSSDFSVTLRAVLVEVEPLIDSLSGGASGFFVELKEVLRPYTTNDSLNGSVGSITVEFA